MRKPRPPDGISPGNFTAKTVTQTLRHHVGQHNHGGRTRRAMINPGSKAGLFTLLT